MANLLSIARPYALAAFNFARDQQQLPAWIAFLNSAAYIARLPAVVHLFADPETPSNLLLDLFQGTLSEQLNAEQKNFLVLLGQAKRLVALPEITELFLAHYATLEKTSSVRVTTAIEAKEDYRQKLAQALSKRLQREVTLECDVDPAIIGGAVIQIGDRVIDGSVRGKLARLLETLTS